MEIYDESDYFQSWLNTYLIFVICIHEICLLPIITFTYVDMGWRLPPSLFGFEQLFSLISHIRSKMLCKNSFKFWIHSLI